MTAKKVVIVRVERVIKGSDFAEGFSRTVEDDAKTVNFLDLRMCKEGAASEFGRVNNEIVLGFE